MNRCTRFGMMALVTLGATLGATLTACASTGTPRHRAAGDSPPETRALQQVEVDGSVRVRANHYRGR